jgi:hypothetical protein
VRLWDAEEQSLVEEFDIESTIVQLAFTHNGTHLITDQGMIALSPSLVSPSEARCYLIAGNWVTWDDEKILWLPPDYRPSSVTVRNNIIVLGLPSGGIIFLRFKASIDPIA